MWVQQPHSFPEGGNFVCPNLPKAPVVRAESRLHPYQKKTHTGSEPWTAQGIKPLTPAEFMKLLKEDVKS
jgi:hypothetical protein